MGRQRRVFDIAGKKVSPATYASLAIRRHKARQLPHIPCSAHASPDALAPGDLIFRAAPDTFRRACVAKRPGKGYTWTRRLSNA